MILYSEYSNELNYSTALMRSYRTTEWKLVKDFKDTKLRMKSTHLSKDPEGNGLTLIGKIRMKINELSASWWKI